MSNLAAYAVALEQLFTVAPEMAEYLVPEAESPQNWVAFANAQGHRFLIARSMVNTPICHTSLPIGPGQSHHVRGTVLPSKHNGKIQAHFPFNADFVRRHVLPLLADASVPLPASRRAASGPASGRVSLTASEILARVAAKRTALGLEPTPPAPVAPALPAADEEFSDEELAADQA